MMGLFNFFKGKQADSDLMGIYNRIKSLKNQMGLAEPPFKKQSEANAFLGQNIAGGLANQFRGTKASWLGASTSTSSISSSGKPIDFTTLIRNPVFMAIVRHLTAAVSQLDFVVAAKDDKSLLDLRTLANHSQNAKKAKEIGRILDYPNNFQTWGDFISQCMVWWAFTGEVFIQVVKETAGVRLYVLDSSLVTPGVQSLGNDLVPIYQVSTPIARTAGNLNSPGLNFTQYMPKGKNVLSMGEVIHLKELDVTGFSGFQKAVACSDIIALMDSVLAIQQILLAKAPLPAIAIQRKSDINSNIEDQSKKLKDMLSDLEGMVRKNLNMYGGFGNQTLNIPRGLANEFQDGGYDSKAFGGLFMAPAGYEFFQLPYVNTETLKLNELYTILSVQLCAIMGTSAAKLGLETTKFNNHQELTEEEVRNTFSPFLKTFGDKLTENLLGRSSDICIKISTIGLYKGDPETMTRLMVQSSWLSVNEKRKLMNLPPIEGEEYDKPPVDGGKTKQPEPLSVGQDTGGGGGALGIPKTPKLDGDDDVADTA